MNFRDVPRTVFLCCGVSVFAGKAAAEDFSHFMLDIAECSAVAKAIGPYSGNNSKYFFVESEIFDKYVSSLPQPYSANAQGYFYQVKQSLGGHSEKIKQNGRYADELHRWWNSSACERQGDFAFRHLAGMNPSAFVRIRNMVDALPR